MSLARSGVKKSPVTMRSQRLPCSPGIWASNWMLTQFISSPSRLAISLPSSIRMPCRLPFSSMYWTGGRVALVATTSLPGRTTAGGATAGAVGYFVCAWAKVGTAIVLRTSSRTRKRRPELRMGYPPVGLRAWTRPVPAGWSTASLAGQKASSIYHESSRVRSAATEGCEGGFHGGGFFGAERDGAEAAPLVDGGEAREGRRGAGRLRLHALRELARRLRWRAAQAPTGQEAQGPQIEARHRSWARPSRRLRCIALQDPRQEDDGAGRRGHGGRRQAPRPVPPAREARAPLGRAAMHRRGDVHLVPEAPVDDVAVPPHPHRVHVEAPRRGSPRGLLDSRARRRIQRDPACAVEECLDP